MKCPKCSYIGFEEADRCRNCGYEFALSDARPAPPDLPMRAGDDADGPLPDLSLSGPPAREGERRRTAPGKPRLDLDRMIGGEPQSSDLPLFGDAADPAHDLPPMVSAPAAPRRPLAVRRNTPPPSRARRPQAEGTGAGGTLDLPLPRYASSGQVARATATAEYGAVALAGPARRVSAALLDLVLLGGVHSITVYFTLRLCGLNMGEWRVLPLVPLLAFFLLVDGAYLVTFTTAGGQTIGKMTFGLRVVADGDEGVPMAVAAGRALGAIASTLCLGAGLLPALLHEDRRAVHDRLAGTHVVRLPA
jgi:uncharacterized RDD family membrane protein YckC